QAMANRLGRGIENAHIGTTITDPNVDYATVARGFGVYGEGPITDPNDLPFALKRALAVVRRGEPALIDVVTDPRRGAGRCEKRYMSSARLWWLARSGSADSIGRRWPRTHPSATRSKASVSISPSAASLATAGPDRAAR